MSNNSNEAIKQFLYQFSMMPGIGPGVRDLLDTFMGKAPYGLNWLTINSQRSLPWNVESAQRSQFMSGNLYDAHETAAKLGTQNVLTNLYKLAGFKNAKGAAASAATGPFADFAAMLIAPQLTAAYDSFGKASYKRLTARDVSTYGASVGNFYKDVLTGAINGKYAGLDIGEVGAVASQLIGTGALESSGMTSSGIDERINRIKKELTSYSHSVGALKDVIDGPVEKILKSFEELTGNKMTTMSAGRVEMISNAMRNVMFYGGVTPQQLANYTTRQYGLIAPYGGTMQQANAMAIATAAAVSSGVRIEGLSDERLGEALAKDNANQLISGNVRRQAAAYQHWRLANKKEDNAFTMEEFRRTVNTEQYLQSANIDESFYSSRLVTNTMANPEFFSQNRAEQLKEYKNAIKNIDISNYKEKDKISNILNNEYDPSRMLERLVSEGGLDSNTATQLVSQVEAAAMSSFQNANEIEAMGMAGTAANAERMQRVKLGGITLQKLRGQTIEGGLGGVMKLIASNPDNTQMGVASLFTTWLSGNVGNQEELESNLLTQLKEHPEEVEKMLAGLGKENVAALLGAEGADVTWSKGNVLANAAGAMVKVNKDGTPKLEKEELVAAKKDLLTAIRTGKSGGREVDMATFKKLTENFEFSEKDIYTQYLAAKTGSGEITDSDAQRYMKLAADQKAGVKERYLKRTKKKAAELDDKDKQLIENEAAELGLLQYQGQQAAEVVRLSGTTGIRTKDETFKAIVESRKNAKNKEEWAETAEGKAWNAAAAAVKANKGGKEEGTPAEVEEYLKKNIISKGTVEEFLIDIITLFNKLITKVDEKNSGTGSTNNQPK